MTADAAKQIASAVQLIEYLNAPSNWYSHILDEVVASDEEMLRRITLSFSDELRKHAKDSTPVLIVLTKPRRGIAQQLTLKTDDKDVRVRMLTHEEHDTMARLLIKQRHSEVTAAISAEVPDADRDQFARHIRRSIALLNDLPSLTRFQAAANVAAAFDGAWLTGYPASSNDRVRESMDRLHALCFELSERYYKIIEIVARSEGPYSLTYSYPQEIENRVYGIAGFRYLRTLFHAPVARFIIHAPVAKLCSNYEYRMEPFTGYFVHEQRALTVHDTRFVKSVEPSTRAVISNAAPREPSGPWVSRSRGGTVSPHLFIGDGPLSNRRIYIGVRLRQIPPGSPGRAFTAHLLTTLIAGGLIGWSLSHSASQPATTAGLLAALTGVGSVVVDNTMKSADIVNSPLGPRLSLLLQTMLMLVLAVWLLARSTVQYVVHWPKGSWFAFLSKFFQATDVTIGLVLFGGLLGLLIYISIKAGQNVRAFTQVFQQHRTSLDKTTTEIDSND